MRIRYVVSTMIFWWRENHLSLEQECDFIKSHGFGIELWPNIKDQNECRYERKNWQRLQGATEGMLVSMRSRTDDPTLEQWDEQLQCAKMLDANLIADIRSLGLNDGDVLNGDGFATDVFELAEHHKVKICIETGSLNTVKSIGERFDSIWFCLDIGYANLDPAFEFKQYVDQLSGRIAHLHLTDNYGQTDDHEPPGLNGGIQREDWQYLLNALEKQDNDVIGSFEMFPCMPAVMLRKASEFLFNELKWPGKPQLQQGYPANNYNPS